MKPRNDPKQEVSENEGGSLQEIILRNWNQLTEIHRERRKRKIEQLFHSAIAGILNDTGRSPRFNRIFLNLMNDQEANRFLWYQNPKSFKRIEGHIQAARREFSSLARRQDRVSLKRLLKRVGLDPAGPYPKNLVEKYGRRYNRG